MITKEITIEELVEKIPNSVKYLMEKGIKCIACGEPIWGTLEEAALEKGDALPFDVKGQVIYYMGPAPAKPGQVIGSAGPTTSGRMDVYTPALLAAGLKGMVGKGNRSDTVKQAMKQYGAVYFAATGGAGALIARTIKKVDIIAYEDLGTEAIRRLEVEQLPVIVVNDMYGGDLYEEGKARYRIKS